MFLSKITIYLSLDPHKGRHFALLDPDPADQSQCGSGPETLVVCKEFSAKQFKEWDSASCF
jgi:hypothetical protein